MPNHIDQLIRNNKHGSSKCNMDHLWRL